MLKQKLITHVSSLSVNMLRILNAKNKKVKKKICWMQISQGLNESFSCKMDIQLNCSFILKNEPSKAIERSLKFLTTKRWRSSPDQMG